jgi:hypothetical protein
MSGARTDNLFLDRVRNPPWAAVWPPRKIPTTLFAHHLCTCKKLIRRLWADFELAAKSPDIRAWRIRQGNKLSPALDD